MKYLTRAFVFFYMMSISFICFAQNSKLIEETVLEEIQKTFVKDYGVNKSYWYIPNKTSGATTPSPIKKPKTQKSRMFDNRSAFNSKKTISHKKTKSKKKTSWMDSKMSQSNSWQKNKVSKVNNWANKKIKLVNKWRKEKKKYQKKIPVYKSNLYSFNSIKKEASTPLKINKKYPATPKLVAKNKYKIPKMVMIPGAFKSRVLDQGKRPTCSAFAATRAMEIILSKNNPNYKPISPQYVYYASKPKCQSSPCNKKGSWPRAFFLKSLNANSADIPTLRDCPYGAKSITNNETQLPLGSGCFNGRYKVRNFSQTKSFNEIKEALNNGYPVIGGVKLSPNFYKNKGVVFYKDSKKKGKIDSHSVGHAILFVGHMKIPPTLNEGSICLITSNSWGKGWGVGGFSCLSERWIKEFSFDIPFLALKSVR